MHVSPLGFGERLPKAISLQTEVKKPVGLTLLLGDKPDNVLIQSFGNDICLDIRGEAKLILLVGHLFHKLIVCLYLHMMMNGLFKIFHRKESIPSITSQRMTTRHSHPCGGVCHRQAYVRAHLP